LCNKEGESSHTSMSSVHILIPANEENIIEAEKKNLLTLALQQKQMTLNYDVCISDFHR